MTPHNYPSQTVQLGSNYTGIGEGIDGKVVKRIPIKCLVYLQLWTYDLEPGQHINNLATVESPILNAHQTWTHMQ